MRFSTIFSASALSITLPLFASARHGSLNARKHRDVSRRDGIAGLFTNTRFTYYDISVGQVACEGWHKPSEFVVALNGAQYGTYWKSPSCGKEIIINFGGKTARATVVDMCPGCPYGGLDLTQGLFEYFSDVSAGVIHGSWSWADGSSGSGSVDSGADYIVAAAPAAKAASYTRPAVAKPASTQPAASKPKSTLKTPKPQTQKPQTQKPQSQKPQTPKPQAPKQQAPKPPTIPNKPSKPKVTPKPVAIPATPKPKIVASLGGNGTTTSQAPAPTNKCPGRLRSRAQMNVADWS